MKKLLCFDLDDTILNTDKTISEENKAAVAAAIDAGCYVAIVTGRSVSGGASVAKELGMLRKNCFLVCFQGNGLYDLSEKRLLYFEGIPRDDAVRLLEELKKKGIYAQTYNATEILIPKEAKEFLKYKTIVTVEQYRAVPDWDKISEPYLPKVMAIDYEDYDRLKAFRDYFMELPMAGGFDVFFSCTYYLEFCRKEQNKGFGVRRLADYLGVPMEDTIVIGDERNDIPMLSCGAFSVAMQNAHHSVKEYADYITERDNNHAGVAEVIERFIL